jgi:penicillin-binding protein 1C
VAAATPMLSQLRSAWRHLRRATVARRLLLLCAFLAGITLAAGLTLRAATAWMGPPPFASVAESSKLVLDRRGALLRPFTTPGGLWRLPLSADDIDPRYFALLFAYEDRRFYQHNGVDWQALGRAVWQVVSNGRALSGGSTLTMQAARLLDDQPTRSYVAKIGQMLRAWQLEAQMSKREILELYMKLAPYGGNIEGVRAASLAYFGKEPKRLTVAEAALLVALPQSPEQRRPDRGAAITRTARDRVVERAADAGAISQAEADWAKRQPVPTERKNFPALAAHLSERMANASSASSIRLTIDARLQQSVEALAARQAARVGPKVSAAIMVLDKTSGEVLAHVGSAGYFDQDRNGPIDMTQAVRSPGSALKPFIYGLGFEDGLGHPDMTIEDRPVRIGGYAPENFDDVLHGTVSLRRALQLSLNVPAVKMLHAVGPARLAGRLRQAGFAIEVPRNLTVALGGVGLRLEDLIGMYAALAHGGEPLALQYRLADMPGAEPVSATPAAQALLSPVAAWYLADIMRGAPPPAHAKGGGIAFKTGTSYGFRDAWAAGFDGQYVAAVWLGRPDNSSTPGMTGLGAAAPLLFDVFTQLGPERVAFSGPPPGAITRASGPLPPPLAAFREKDAATVTQSAQADPPVQIAFPPDKAELELAADTDGLPEAVSFKAEGGQLPFTWLVNGTPIETPPHRREAFWRPTGKGFVQLSVIDARGRVDKVTVRLR